MEDIENTFVFPIIRDDFILDALQSLPKVTPPNYKVIVIDQTGADRNRWAEIWNLSDLLIVPKVNYGFAQAANLGIRLATTEYITVCNDDVVFVWPWWWQGIEVTFKRHPTAIAVNPTSPREPWWGYGLDEGEYAYSCMSCGDVIKNKDKETGELRCRCGENNALDTIEKASIPNNITQISKLKNGAVVDGIATWCTTFKKSFLDEHGLYDERFFPGGSEDYDMNGRAYTNGYRMLGTSMSWVWHWWGKSKDDRRGMSQALPSARPSWCKLGDMWPNGFDVWGKDKEGNFYERTPEIVRKPL